MLCTNKAMIEAMCFIHGKLNHFFRARGKSHLTANDTPTTPDDCFNGMTDLVYFNPQVAEHMSGNTLPFA